MKIDSYLKNTNFLLWLALKHHKTHKGVKLNFNTHPYQRALYLDKTPYLVVMKSTQSGITEYLIIRSLSKAIKGQSVFHVLPTYSLVGRFVKNRIDKSINNTPYYKQLEIARKNSNDVSKRSDSISLKDIGKGTIAYVGSNSTSAFSEFPADDLCIDELDECDQANIEMAWERLSHSEFRTQCKIANPTLMDYGIDKEYKTTNKMKWSIKHNCGHWIFYDWFEQAVRQVSDNKYVIRDKNYEWNNGKDINLICPYCNKPIDRNQDGVWVPEKKEIKDRHGYQQSKLFTGTVSLTEIMDRFKRGLKNDTVMQRFFNADLGIGYTAPGAKITRTMLDDAKGSHSNFKPIKGLGIAGIDVGSVLNVIIGYVQSDGKVLVSGIMELPADRRELIKTLIEYNVRITVIDALPEQNFVNRLKTSYKNVFSCWYTGTKTEPVDKYQNVSINRTASLDSVKESLMSGVYILPGNADSIINFYSQMQAATRVWQQKKDSLEGVYNWIETGPDHYHHAMNYMNIARKLVSAAIK